MFCIMDMYVYVSKSMYDIQVVAGFRGTRAGPEEAARTHSGRW